MKTPSWSDLVPNPSLKLSVKMISLGHEGTSQLTATCVPGLSIFEVALT